MSQPRFLWTQNTFPLNLKAQYCSKKNTKTLAGGDGTAVLLFQVLNLPLGSILFCHSVLSFIKYSSVSCYCKMLTQEHRLCQSDILPTVLCALAGPGVESGCDCHNPGGGGNFLGQAPGQLDALG